MIELRQTASAAAIRGVAENGSSGCRVAGYAARTETVASLPDFDERILRGVFDPLVVNPGCNTVLDFNHNPDQPLATLSAGNLRLGSDQYGLWFCADLPPTSLGRDMAILIRRGILSACSFSFSGAQDSWQMVNGRPLRTIRSISRLNDVSVVLQPCYPTTSVCLGDKPIARSADLSAERLRLLEICGLN